MTGSTPQTPAPPRDLDEDLVQVGASSDWREAPATTVERGEALREQLEECRPGVDFQASPVLALAPLCIDDAGDRRVASASFITSTHLSE